MMHENEKENVFMCGREQPRFSIFPEQTTQDIILLYLFVNENEKYESQGRRKGINR